MEGEPSIHLAILRGIVEGRLDKYMGATAGISCWLDELEEWGYIIGPRTVVEEGEEESKWLPTDKGLELYRKAQLEDQPAGRWYFHREVYQWPEEEN